MPVAGQGPPSRGAQSNEDENGAECAEMRLENWRIRGAAAYSFVAGAGAGGREDSGIVDTVFDTHQYKGRTFALPNLLFSRMHCKLVHDDESCNREGFTTA